MFQMMAIEALRRGKSFNDRLWLDCNTWPFWRLELSNHLPAHVSRWPDHRRDPVFRLGEDAVHKVSRRLDGPGGESSGSARFLDDAEVVRDEPADLVLDVIELARMSGFIQKGQRQVGAAEHIEC